MSADENLNNTHKLCCMFGVNKVGIFPVHVEDIFEHTKNQTGDCEYLRERTETDFFWDCYE